MKKKLRKNLWGIQWIFLKAEKRTNKKPQTRNSLDFVQIEDSVASDIDDFPEIPLHKIEDFVSTAQRSSRLYNEKFKMPGGIGLPNLSYEDPGNYVRNTRNSFVVRQERERIVESAKNSRPRTVEIRKISFPDKLMNRVQKNEPDTSTNRRKNYGKWFIPPNKWNDSLSHFTNKK